jgi:FkbM family methyltransferase
MRITRQGIAVIHSDSHIGKWVEENGRLDHDQNMLPLLSEHINEGDVVLDIGANIGSHAIFYSNLVGYTGQVMCFEPNLRAWECLKYNLGGIKNVQLLKKAVSDKPGKVDIVEPNENYGMAYTVEGGKTVECITIDSLNLKRCDFIKMDIEGNEYKALLGAAETIRAHKPTMLIEINKPALARANTSFTDIATLLKIWGYSIENVYKEQGTTDIKFDILCKHTQQG